MGDCWFMSALACIAEFPDLVKKLFITRDYQRDGIYRVQFCKDGIWQEVTVDDFFPCSSETGGLPIFSRASGNELWVLLLEKAYAKLHGNYFTLRGGYAYEALMDLTGCPTSNFDFKEESNQKIIKDGTVFNDILHYDEQNFCISASTAGEDLWADNS